MRRTERGEPPTYRLIYRASPPGSFFIEPDRVLFAGDIVMPAQPGLHAQSTIDHWLTSLERVDALQPQRIVPSHGAMGDAAMIANYRTYLQTIQTRVAALKRDGKNIEETAQAVASELEPRYPDRNRTMTAVRVAYNQP